MIQIINKSEVLESMFAKDGMSFSKKDGWNTLAEHVDVHNRNLEQELGIKVSWDDALFSWYENVYFPLKTAMASHRIKRLFPNTPYGELYLAVSDHWYYLKESYSDVDGDLAVANYIYNSRKNSNRFLSRLFGAVETAGEAGPKRKHAA